MTCLSRVGIPRKPELIGERFKAKTSGDGDLSKSDRPFSKAVVEVWLSIGIVWLRNKLHFSQPIYSKSKKENTLINVHNVDSVNVMNVDQVNFHLYSGKINEPGLFPRLRLLKNASLQLKIDFGLEGKFPSEGILVIRGPRQFGKSTWLEQKLYDFVKTNGPASAFYLNGDEIINAIELREKISDLCKQFSKKKSKKAFFIDEITSVKGWEKALKVLADRGDLEDILVVTTGSKATDLRRGHEKLPGRKGKLARSEYIFTPVSFKEFHRHCKGKFKQNTLYAYLLSGGSPLAINEIYDHGTLPEYLITMTKDWIFGEIAASGRERSSLLAIFELLYKWGGSPVGFTKLAKEAGMANNTVAHGYIELLKDLLCVTTASFYQPLEERIDKKKPSKFPFICLLAAVAFHSKKMRSVDDFLSLTEEEQGIWLEWLVAQEIYRRKAIQGVDLPEELYYWKSSDHEIDFVNVAEEDMIEVKRGQVSPFEFQWFHKVFPNKKLYILASSQFETHHLQCLKIEDWLLS